MSLLSPGTRTVYTTILSGRRENIPFSSAILAMTICPQKLLWAPCGWLVWGRQPGAGRDGAGGTAGRVCGKTVASFFRPEGFAGGGACAACGGGEACGKTVGSFVPISVASFFRPEGFAGGGACAACGGGEACGEGGSTLASSRTFRKALMAC